MSQTEHTPATPAAAHLPQGFLLTIVVVISVLFVVMVRGFVVTVCRSGSGAGNVLPRQ